MNQVEQEGRALEMAIAGRIREKRLERGFTLERLAQFTGLSKGYLSQIENGEKTPPIGTLTKIAYGLRENVITLISGEVPQEAPRKLDLTGPDKHRSIVHTGAAPGTVYESFGFTKPDRLMDSYVVTISHEYPPNPFVHNGQEIAIMLEGEQEFFYDGTTYRLKEGDALYFDSDRPHMARSLSKKPARVLVVFCNPKGQG